MNEVNKNKKESFFQRNKLLIIIAILSMFISITITIRLF